MPWTGLRSVSTSFQFEDRLAAGVALGHGAVSLTHYSNAGIRRPNDGLNVTALGYRLGL